MVNNYEIALIFKDNETAAAEGLKNVKEILQNFNIEITGEDVWGSRKLAYPIEKEKNGYYVFLKVKGDSLNIKKIERDLKLNNNILRFMVIKEDKKKVK